MINTNHTNKIISFVPKPLIHWITENRLEKRFPAVVVFADVSGFTKMSSQLAAIGHEGAEILTAILNNYFTQMIGSIELAGGFVGKFGGDAMTIFFPAWSIKRMKGVTRRAVANSLKLQSMMVDFKKVETKAGTFSLGMKIGVAAGEVLFRVVGPEREGGREYLLAGLPLDRAAEAEHKGSSGEVIITPLVLEISGIGGTELEDGFIRVNEKARISKTGFKLKKAIPKPVWKDIAKTFIDPAIYRRMLLGLDSVGEIRRVSVIFMSFTGLDYDVDKRVGQKLEDVYNWVYSLTERYGASINKVDMGDKGSKMIITFGTPVAHENNEERAVRCGLELLSGHDNVRRQGVEQRIGISSGVVFAGEVGAPSRQEYTVMGSTVNLSARIMAYSKSGQLLIDDVTYNRIEQFFEFADPIYAQFKGIAKPMPIHEVIGLKVKERYVLETERKPLIGRKKEISQIDSLIQNVIKSRTSTLLIQGDPGIGKTRIAEDVLDKIRTKDFTIAAGEALSYAVSSPYLIWISIIRKLMELPVAGGGDKVLKQLNDVVLKVDAEHAFRTPIIANLLGIECPDNNITRHFDAQLRKENTYDFLVQYFKHITRKSSLALFFEDCQWIDRSSLDLLTFLQRSLPDCPLLFIIAKRRESRFEIDSLMTEIKENETTVSIVIKELSKEETERMILNELGADSISTEMMEFIFDSSQGNASFTEQLIANLRALDRIKILPDAETGKLVAEKVGDLAEVEVPDSLSSLIMSQIDRLGPEAKLTVKVASVIGRQFEEEVLSKSYPIEMDDEAINKSVEELRYREFIKRATEKEHYNYIFKNLLTVDVAYDSLLFAHRREYHRRIGLCIEGLKEDSLMEWYEELARHFYRSEDARRAVLYLGKSGDKAYDIFANDSAEGYYTDSLERAADETFLKDCYKLLTMRSKVFSIIGKIDLQKRDLDESLILAERRSNLKDQVNTLTNMARYYYRVNELDEMKQTIDHAQEILKKIDYPFGRININDKMGIWHFVQNQFKDALRYWQLSKEEAENVNDEKGLASALTNCGLAYKAMGDFDRALDYYSQSAEYSRKISDMKSEAVNLGNIGVLHHQRGELQKALEAYQQALEIARSIGSKQIHTYYLGNLGILYQSQGQPDQAFATYNELLYISRQTRHYRAQVQSLSNFGSWYRQKGDLDQAISHYEQALEIARKNNLRSDELTIMINMGMLYHYQDELDRAQGLLEQAIQLSLEITNKYLEDYARRYLGFVLIDKDLLEDAEREFTTAHEIASSIGGKVGMASAKIGIGWIKLLRDGDRSLIEEGIAEAAKISDVENVLKGKIGLARVLTECGENKEAMELLKHARDLASANGYQCDVDIIERMITRLRG